MNLRKFERFAIKYSEWNLLTTLKVLTISKFSSQSFSNDACKQESIFENSSSLNSSTFVKKLSLSLKSAKNSYEVYTGAAGEEVD